MESEPLARWLEALAEVLISTHLPGVANDALDAAKHVRKLQADNARLRSELCNAVTQTANCPRCGGAGYEAERW